MLGNISTGLQFIHQNRSGPAISTKMRFIIPLLEKSGKSYKPSIACECSYSIYSTQKREYKSIHEKTKEKTSRFIKCDKSARGASGDIGFTPKPSDTNGLRAVEQQYLHQKPNISYGFWGRSSDGASFFLAQKQGRGSPTID